MLDLVLCHAGADTAAAAGIAARLERAEARVWLEECRPGETVAGTWEAGLSSAAILLLLSPDSVPARSTRLAWNSVLEHVEQRASPPVGAVLLRDCPYPRLLERGSFFQWADGQTAVLRSLERWVLSLHAAGETPFFVPASLPWFRGRQQELELLWDSLVDRSGTVVLANADPASGKTCLAQEFARAARAHFRDVLWVECGDRAPALVAGDLAWQLGAHPETAPLGELVEQHRLLIVLDDVVDEPPLVASPDGRASVLITARSGSLPLPPHARVVAVESAPARVRGELPEGGVEQRLWQAMTACRRNGFRLELAAAIADLDAGEAQAACERLLDGGWVDPFDAAGTQFRLAGAETAAGIPHRKHTEAVSAVFREGAAGSQRWLQFLGEMETALRWAVGNDWTMAVSLGRRAFKLLSVAQRLREAVWVYEQILDGATARGDEPVAEDCRIELSWIRGTGGGIRPRARVYQQLWLDFTPA